MIGARCAQAIDLEMMKTFEMRARTFSQLERRPLDRALIVTLLVALALRLLLWGSIPRTGLISDEGEYFAAASWLVQGRGFAWYHDYLWTRAPLYPLFLAAHLRLFGAIFTPIYISQTFLSLVNVVLVYRLAQRLLPLRVAGSPVAGAARFAPTLAALAMGLSFPFAVYTQVLLSETLYLTLLLGGFRALLSWHAARDTASPERNKPDTFASVLRGMLRWSLILAGALFGLATLTRSLTLFFLPLVAAWIALGGAPRSRSRRWLPGQQGVASALVFLACAVAPILPWTIYNSRLYGGLVVVDTSGAYNLLVGARTAYDGARKDGPPRDFMLGLLGQRPASADISTCAPYPGQLPTQAARQTAITREGLCLIRAKPLAFVKKTLGELIDVFQINYSGDERFTDHFTTGRLSRWYAIGLFVLDDTLYVLTLPLALIGWALVRGRNRGAGIVGLWWLYMIAVAPLLFAINRFRLPLLPFAFIFAAYALLTLGSGWRRLQTRYGVACTVLALLLAIIATAPYAYLYPPAQAQALASYLGPHPSSLNSTVLAITARPRYLNTERLHQALLDGDSATVAAILQSGQVTPALQAFGPALLAERQGRYAEAVTLLPPSAALADDQELLVAANVIYGDLLRSMGDDTGARAALGPTLVDNANPVEWAWDWLKPKATRRIDLAGDLDLGYIRGCYLGENNPPLDGTATFRWCTDGAQLRFPGAGSAAEQALVLRADGRGWPDDMLPVPAVQVLVGEQVIGSFTPDHAGAREFNLRLPPLPPGADVVVTLRTPTFVPSAVDYLNQQGVLVGQVRRLGVRLDWAELRGPPQ
jgi:4-amino-4-deoxy-L-arabinose transferase-like glycosyltransferase